MFDDVDVQGDGHGLARIGQPETSLAAWARVEPHRRPVYERIVAIIRSRGPIGATVHEVAHDMGKGPSDISGRLTELRSVGRLRLQLDRDGKPVKRGGARVLILTEQFARGELDSEGRS